MKRTFLAAALALSLVRHTPAQEPSHGDNMTLTAVDGHQGRPLHARRAADRLHRRPDRSRARPPASTCAAAHRRRATPICSIPTKMVEQIFGVALSGGSLFGLSTGDGVLRYLEEKNIGIVVRQPAHSDRAGRIDLRSRRRRRADPPDRRLRLPRRAGGDRRAGRGRQRRRRRGRDARQDRRHGSRDEERRRHRRDHACPTASSSPRSSSSTRSAT